MNPGATIQAEASIDLGLGVHGERPDRNDPLAPDRDVGPAPGAPVPSMTVPFLSTRSAAIGSSATAVLGETKPSIATSASSRPAFVLTVLSLRGGLRSGSRGRAARAEPSLDSIRGAARIAPRSRRRFRRAIQAMSAERAVPATKAIRSP